MLESKSNSHSRSYPLRGVPSTGLLMVPLTHQIPNSSCFRISGSPQHNHKAAPSTSVLSVQCRPLTLLEDHKDGHSPLWVENRTTNVPREMCREQPTWGLGSKRPMRICLLFSKNLFTHTLCWHVHEWINMNHCASPGILQKGAKRLRNEGKADSAQNTQLSPL